MGLFSKKDDKRKINTFYIDGLNIYSENTPITLILDDDKECLVIESKLDKNLVVNLKYEQITAANVVTKKEVLETSKNSLGRAAVGGVLLGPLGAIVGGISGVGNKKSEQLNYYIVINYLSKENEVRIMSFEIGGFVNWRSFINDLKSKIINRDVKKDIYL